MLFVLNHACVSSAAYTVSLRISFLLPNSFLCGKLFFLLFFEQKEKNHCANITCSSADFGSFKAASLVSFTVLCLGDEIKYLDL